MTDQLYSIHEGNPNTGDLQGADAGIRQMFGAMFDVKVAIGNLADELRSDRRRQAAIEQATAPVFHRSPASGVAVANVNLVLPLGGPDTGRYWEIRECIIGGTDVNVTAAGTAGLYVAANRTAAVGLSNCLDFTTFLPNASGYSAQQVVVQPNEKVFVVVFGGTEGQTYLASISVTDLPVGRGSIVTES